MPFELAVAAWVSWAWVLKPWWPGQVGGGPSGVVPLAPAAPMSALLSITADGFWLAIWRKCWCWWGLLPAVLGVALAWRATSPDMPVAADARTIAIADPMACCISCASLPTNMYVARDWLARDGDSRDAEEAVGVAPMHFDGFGYVPKG